MFKIDQFLWKDLLKSFRKGNVAYFIDDVQTYRHAPASIRMQCYDMILWLEAQGIHAELYKPFKTYHSVFFIKTRSDRAVRTAKKLSDKGTRLFMYTYCECMENRNPDNWERKNILNLLKNMEKVFVVGRVQQEIFQKYHADVIVAGDHVNASYFSIQKKHEKKKKTVLLYCGYSQKACDLLCMKEILNQLTKQAGCELLLLSDKDPQLHELTYTYMKYDQNQMPEQFLLGDIMIAPRPMKGIQSLSHSNTKIACPMAVGLPVAASPVPSYLDSPAIICTSNEEWHRELCTLISSPELRSRLGQSGRDYMEQNYSIDKIGSIYKKFIMQ